MTLLEIHHGLIHIATTMSFHIIQPPVFIVSVLFFYLTLAFFICFAKILYAAVLFVSLYAQPFQQKEIVQFKYIP